MTRNFSQKSMNICLILLDKEIPWTQFHLTWEPFFNQNESTSWKHLPQFMAMKTVHTISRDTKHHKFWDRKIGLFVRTKLFFYFFNPMWSQLMKVFHTYTDPGKLWDMLRKWLNQLEIVSSKIIDFTFIEHFSALS